MCSELARREDMDAFLDKLSGKTCAGGDPRLKVIVRKIVADLFATIDTYDVSPEEFWAALNFLAECGGSGELGLWAPGLGFERFLDVRMDEADRKRGVSGGTPRTIEGPLYVANAPLSKGEARLDDGTDKGEVLIMRGQVCDTQGKPIPGAVVDVWHANTLGNYSFFDKSQSTYNLRRRIEADAEGCYKFRTIMPSGYNAPPGGTTDRLLKALGRQGRRPAHIHFFVSAPGHRHLTTQINIAGDPHLFEDFAYGTREELIPEVTPHSSPADMNREGLNAPYKEIGFDFVLTKTTKTEEASPLKRTRVAAV